MFLKRVMSDSARCTPVDCSKTAETTITKLAAVVNRESWRGKKIKGQGHRITKCKKHTEGDRVAGVSLHSIECPASSYCVAIMGDSLTLRRRE